MAVQWYIELFVKRTETGIEPKHEIEPSFQTFVTRQSYTVTHLYYACLGVCLSVCIQYTSKQLNQ